jgi:LysM repeat protein
MHRCIFVKKLLFLVITLCVIGLLGSCASNESLIENSQGYKGDKATQDKRDQPPWVKDSKISLSSDDGWMRKSSTYGDKTNKTLPQAKNNAKTDALGEIARKIFQEVTAELKDTVMETQDRVATMTRAETYSRSDVFVQGFHEIDSFWERHSTKKTGEYFDYWGKYAISQKDIDESRKVALEIVMDEKRFNAQMIQSEGKRFGEVMNDYTQFSSDLTKFEDKISEAEYYSYLSKYDNLLALKRPLQGLITFTTDDKNISQSEDLRSEYKTLMDKLAEDERRYPDEVARHKEGLLTISDLAETIDDLVVSIEDLQKRLGGIAGINVVQAETIDGLRDLQKGLVALENTNAEQAKKIDALTSIIQGDSMAVVDAFSENMLAAMSSALTPESIQNAKWYVVKQGDYLAKIARLVYGNAFYYGVIVAANKDRINSKNPDRINPGVRLRIPELPPNLKPEKILSLR